MRNAIVQHHKIYRHPQIFHATNLLDRIYLIVFYIRFTTPHATFTANAHSSGIETSPYLLNKNTSPAPNNKKSFSWHIAP